MSLCDAEDPVKHGKLCHIFHRHKIGCLCDEVHVVHICSLFENIGHSHQKDTCEVCHLFDIISIVVHWAVRKTVMTITERQKQW